MSQQLAQPRAREVTTRLRDAILGSWQETRTLIEPEKGIRFRCSDVGYMCPRMQTLAAKGGFIVTEVRDAESLWPLGVGTAYHEMFQREILPMLPDGVLQGWWQRTKGDNDAVIPLESTPLVGWHPRPQGKNWAYREMLMEDTDLRLRGRCDGVLVWPGEETLSSRSEILELKSAGMFKKDSLDPGIGGNPEAVHVIQAHCYMILSGLRQTRIVYIIKMDGKFKTILFEHLVKYDETTAEGIKLMLRSTLNAVGKGEILPRQTECASKGDRRAKKCPMREKCFKEAA